jgi:hypothetical protein
MTRTFPVVLTGVTSLNIREHIFLSQKISLNVCDVRSKKTGFHESEVFLNMEFFMVLPSKPLT